MKLKRFELHPGLTAVFTGVEDGDLTMSGRREDARAVVMGVASRAGFAPTDLRRMSQVHSADVAIVAAESGHVPEVDALVDPRATAVPLVLTADCVPVVFAASDAAGGGPMSAVAHAGRKGLLAGILTNTVHRLLEEGAQDIEAWIGPSICGDCYEVPPDMAAEAERQRPGITAQTSWGTSSLDLPGAAQRELRDLGVLTRTEGSCTLSDESYFSYRGGDLTRRNGSLAVPLMNPA